MAKKDEGIFEVEVYEPHRPKFVVVYKDFLECKLLSANEKLVYIVLKSFMRYGNDSGTVYPSLDRISQMAGMSKPRVIRTLDSLADKGAIKKKRTGQNKANTYTLNDCDALWKAKSVEEMRQIADGEIPLTVQELIDELRRRGYKITKNELASQTGQSSDTSPLDDDDNRSGSISEPLGVVSKPNGTENESKCQQNMYSDKAAEEYPLDYLKEKYGYDILITDQRVAPEDADTVINILHRTLNSSKKTIRVGGEDRPAGMVKAVLLKLEYWDLEYAITQYNSQTQKIEKPEAYLLTLLFLAKDQNHLAVSNQVQVDMYGGSSSGAGS